MSHGTKVVDRGWNRIQREFLKSKPSFVKVGIQGDEATEAHNLAGGGSGPTNVMVASVHEYGSPKRSIPERSFFRSTFDKNVKKYRQGLKELAQDLITKKTPLASGLNMLGEEYRGDIINRVRGGKIKQDLSDATQRRRGEEGPALWDTGQMIGALTVELDK